MGRTVPEGWTASLPHPDAKRERFCQHLARGSVSASRAYALIWEVSSPPTAKSNACRVRQEEAVARRVTAIREELARGAEGETEAITEAGIHALMSEATGAFQAALAEGERVMDSPALLASLRRAATVHLGRVQRLQCRGPVNAIIDTGVDPFRAALRRLYLCECAHGDTGRGSAS